MRISMWAKFFALVMVVSLLPGFARAQTPWVLPDLADLPEICNDKQVLQYYVPQPQDALWSGYSSWAMVLSRNQQLPQSLAVPELLARTGWDPARGLSSDNAREDAEKLGLRVEFLRVGDGFLDRFINSVKPWSDKGYWGYLIQPGVPLDSYRVRERAHGKVFGGIDETRRLIIIHDPSYGPCLALPYELFDDLNRSFGYFVTLTGPLPARNLQKIQATPLTSQEQEIVTTWRYAGTILFHGTGVNREEAMKLIPKGVDFARRVESVSPHAASRVYYAVAILYLTIRPAEEALPFAKEALRLWPEASENYYLVGLGNYLCWARSRSGSVCGGSREEFKAKALEHFRKHLELRPYSIFRNLVERWIEELKTNP